MTYPKHRYLQNDNGVVRVEEKLGLLDGWSLLCEHQVYYKPKPEWPHSQYYYEAYNLEQAKKDIENMLKLREEGWNKYRRRTNWKQVE